MSEHQNNKTVPVWNTTRGRILITTVVIIAAVLSAVHGLKQEIGTDFSVFWLAGKHFITGDSLYNGLETSSKFIYPPFAALFFVLFSLLPLKAAAGLFYFTNCLLYVVSFILCIRILEILQPDRPAGKLQMFLSFLFSTQFFFMNLNTGQINELIFVLCLSGVYATLKQRHNHAAVWFVSALFLKVTPLFFVIWILIRIRKPVLKPLFGTAVICFLLPVLFRGFSMGFNDIVTYYQSFLAQYFGGFVDFSLQNHNLGTAVLRLTYPSPNLLHAPFRIFPLQAETSVLIYKTVFSLTCTAFAAYLLFLRRKNFKISTLEISAVFLAWHLLSGITWKPHLVSLLFVFLSFLAIDRNNLTKSSRIVLHGVTGAIIICGMTGRDLIGSAAYDLINGFNILAWSMLLMFLCAIWFSIKSVSSDKNARKQENYVST
jgi:hypothetical protein